MNDGGDDDVFGQQQILFITYAALSFANKTLTLALPRVAPL